MTRSWAKKLWRLKFKRLEPVRRFDALVILDDVHMLEKLHDFDFVIEKIAKKLVGNVIFRNNFHCDHHFMVLRVRELKRHVRNSSESLWKLKSDGSKPWRGKNYLHFRVASAANFLDDFEAVSFEKRFANSSFRHFSFWFRVIASLSAFVFAPWKKSKAWEFSWIEGTRTFTWLTWWCFNRCCHFELPRCYLPQVEQMNFLHENLFKSKDWAGR